MALKHKDDAWRICVCHLDTLHDGVDFGLLVLHKLRPFMIQDIDQMKGVLIDQYLELIKLL